MTAKKIPNSDGSIITASCQFMIRWTKTKKKRNILEWILYIYYIYIEIYSNITRHCADILAYICRYM